MAAYNKFNPFVEAVAEKVHNLGSDVLMVMLTNTAPLATNAVKADITEIAAGGGYTTGGMAAATTSSTQTGGVYKLVLADVVFTATGTIGPFRYAVLYNSTTATGNLIGFWDYGSSLTLNTGETFTVDYDASAGVLTIT
jgi:hypothetical protein